MIKQLNREIRHRPHVAETFPDGNSALMLVCARLLHAAEPQWSNMKHLEAALNDVSIVG